MHATTGSGIHRCADGLVRSRKGTGNGRDAGLSRLQVGADGGGPRLHSAGGDTVVRLRVGSDGGSPVLRSTAEVRVVRLEHAESSAERVIILCLLSRLRMLRLRSTVLVVDEAHDDLEELR